jgi:hypothetical protein
LSCVGFFSTWFHDLRLCRVVPVAQYRHHFSPWFGVNLADVRLVQAASGSIPAHDLGIAGNTETCCAACF